MSAELGFFNPCDHRTKSEPLILDANGVGTTRAPMVNSQITVIEENFEITREPVIRSTTDEVDSLQATLVTNIDFVVQEILHQGMIEQRQYMSGRDYFLTGQNLIFWFDSALIRPNPGELYFVNYRITRKPLNVRVLDPFTVKIAPFTNKSSYMVDYTTSATFCTKCYGSTFVQNGVQSQGVLQDVVYDTDGDFRIVEGTEKLKQDMLRAVLAVRGSNPREPLYGTSIEDSIGTGQAGTIFQSTLVREVKNSLLLLQQLQQLQAAVQDKVDLSEILGNISNVSLIADAQRRNPAASNFRPSDPTSYILSVTVQSAANNFVDFFVPLDSLSNQPMPADTPIIELTNVNISNVSKTDAVITWKTNINTDSIIDFGEDSNLSSRELGNFGTNHLIALTRLKPGTLYYFKVVTLNRGFLYGSELRTLKTLS